MLSFFRVNAVYQLISLLVLLALMRLPLLFQPLPLLIPELQWMLVGEKMGQGFMLYRDVWDSLSPLSALVYWGIDSLFGRSQLAYQIIAGVLTLLQAFYFNYVSGQRQLFTERNYVPGMLYLVFMNLSFDYSTLSPVLMANTFLLVAFGTLIKQMQREGATNEVFEVGFYLSIATLFYLPVFVFIFWIFLSLLLYSGANFRQHTLAFFGFIFPISFTLLLFFFRDSLDDLNRNLLISAIQVRQYNLNDFQAVLVSLFLPSLFGVLGFFRMVAYGRFVNYQTRVQQIMLLWILTGALSVVLMPYLAPMQFVIFVPPIVFFTTNFFLLFRKRWLAEIILLMLVGGILLVQYQGVVNIVPNWNVLQLNNLRTKSASLPAVIQKQKILVVGQDQGEYRDNFPATAYLNWNLARYDLENVNNYASVISVFDNFTADPPTYVIDKAHLMPKIFARLPELAKKYQPTQWKNIYELKKKK
ncbi:MAG: hypothetical protein EAZ32_04205 [Cytophagia bacterium]|nr:MAG: hypothetical protein EAZ46_07470 [Runella sp.]TAG18858.1 MAG: hypothetical protein EAZ38_13770 [Cytophagales bacterium]TAG41179.1 MAG: hypothetical protein EAZ32_04205 [Cytophagia bacterium]TAG58737.1 MAG: hypothetical protein EAZ29_00525 [Runella slithyformis]TAG79799.1 MAG: hypothetical protein EAZ22_10810 [Cytophagales bacterium]